MPPRGRGLCLASAGKKGMKRGSLPAGEVGKVGPHQKGKPQKAVSRQPPNVFNCLVLMSLANYVACLHRRDRVGELASPRQPVGKHA